MEQAAFFCQQHPILTVLMAYVIVCIAGVWFIRQKVSKYRHVGGDEILLDEHEIEIGGDGQ